MFVTDVDNEFIEDAHCGVFVDGGQQSALGHILDECDCFEAYGFTSGVRSADYDDALCCGGEVNIEGDDVFLFAVVFEEECWAVGGVPL